MKRFRQTCMVVLAGMALLCAGTAILRGQNGQGIPGYETVGEPENHAVTVDRLLRYHDSGQYESEIRQVVNSAMNYLSERSASPGDKKLAIVIDVDETALSNWDSMSGCGFCSYGSQLKLYPAANATLIAPTLELFKLARSKKVATFFVTGRRESQRASTAKNLRDAGYSDWDELIMQPDTTKDPARVFKPRNREYIEKKGYHIVLNIGDQASDLAGCCSERVFKLPNPFYLAP
jgi:predicted secreted acid phosphatase